MNSWRAFSRSRIHLIYGILLCVPFGALSQERDCPSDHGYSAEQAVVIAQRKVSGTLNPYAGPHALMVKYKGKCHWLIQISTSRHTNRGNCKRTNGCTLVKMTKLYIDPESGRIAHRQKSKKLYPNYE